MKTEIEMTRATYADEEKIAAAWQEAYGDAFPYKYPHRWEWLFRKNPFLMDKGGEFPFWVAKCGQAVVSWRCAMEVPMELDGHTWRAVYGNLAFTLKDYRRKGLGKVLLKECQRSYPIYVGLDMAPAARRNEYRIGGKPGKPLYMYLKLINRFDADTLYGSAVSVAEKHLGKHWASMFVKIGNYGPKQILACVLSLLFKVHFKNRSAGSLQQDQLKSVEEMSIEEVSKFGKDVDDFWEELRGDYSFAVPRTSNYLNWKYIDQPHVHYKKYLGRNTSGNIEGVLVFRMSKHPEISSSMISEVLLKRKDAGIVKRMLTFAEDELIEAGADMIHCGASTQFLCQALEEQSFRLVRVNVPVFHLSPQVQEKTGFKRILAKDWLLSLGDSDVDQFRLRNQPSFVFLVRILGHRIPGSEDMVAFDEKS